MYCMGMVVVNMSMALPSSESFQAHKLSKMNFSVGASIPQGGRCSLGGSLITLNGLRLRSWPIHTDRRHGGARSSAFALSSRPEPRRRGVIRVASTSRVTLLLLLLVVLVSVLACCVGYWIGSKSGRRLALTPRGADLREHCLLGDYLAEVTDVKSKHRFHKGPVSLWQRGSVRAEHIKTAELSLGWSVFTDRASDPRLQLVFREGRKERSISPTKQQSLRPFLPSEEVEKMRYQKRHRRRKSAWARGWALLETYATLQHRLHLDTTLYCRLHTFLTNMSRMDDEILATDSLAMNMVYARG